MKLLIKIALLPVVIVIDLLTWFCIGMISCSSVLFRIISTLISILGTAVLLTYSVKNGLILLTIAFLISPLGIPLLAVKFLGIFQSIASSIRSI